MCLCSHLQYITLDGTCTSVGHYGLPPNRTRPWKRAEKFLKGMWWGGRTDYLQCMNLSRRIDCSQSSCSCRCLCTIDILKLIKELINQVGLGNYIHVCDCDAAIWATAHTHHYQVLQRFTTKSTCPHDKPLHTLKLDQQPTLWMATTIIWMLKLPTILKSESPCSITEKVA